MRGILKASDGAAQAAILDPGVLAGQARQRADRPTAAEEKAAFPQERSLASKPDPAGDKCAELGTMVEALRGQLAVAEEVAEQREDAAYAKGRLDGGKQSASEAERRIELLADALGKVHQVHTTRLAEYETLALQLARTTLARIFGDEELQAELVLTTLRHQLALVKREFLTRIRVSPEDFGDDKDLVELAASFNGLAIDHDEGLPSGECRIDLKLGCIDLGLPRQWESLCRLFERMALEEPTA